MANAIEIDKARFEFYCREHMSEAEIADIFGVTDETINAWCKRTYKDKDGKSLGFSVISRQKRCEGKSLLIKSAIELAKKNGAVMIFLLKNWCGMSDEVKVQADTSLMQTLLDTLKKD